jgi:hypothetical protein
VPGKRPLCSSSFNFQNIFISYRRELTTEAPLEVGERGERSEESSFSTQRERAERKRKINFFPG